MIEKGYSRGLSLTHIHDGTNILLLEVSICSQPARPCCYVHFISMQQTRAEEYIRDVRSGAITDPVSTNLQRIMSEQAAPQETQKPLIEQALDQLPEEGIKLVSLIRMLVQQHCLLSSRYL